MDECGNDLGALDDTDLLKAARGNGEGPASAAFGELWRRHHGLAVALLRPLAHGDAEDVVSEAFAAVWTQLRSGGGPETHFKAYLVCVAKRLAYRLHTRNRLVTTEISEEDLATSSSHDPTLRIETRAQIATAFRAMPERWVEVLWLQAVEQKTRPELCRSLGLSPNATSALTRRARNGFRQAFELAEA
ncbi:MAG: sigma-70 family RNA polymerase sigma factor [Propionicimonas sp.]